ncbi:Surface antigen [Arachidicoccus rhizosphaerae]|uniref:Surface antigen n=1 Tax=Arachidicoccus rhizosphaerae TaxID=551991 RepID=A0A1H3WW57_9BACT|nr:BamA/TamA family outer membrane protein [Arachidicoccus rhizosphaerae]SDZ91395.1 Surface antigen [Arachidicoccus rhizosphaerae]
MLIKFTHLIQIVKCSLRRPGALTILLAILLAGPLRSRAQSLVQSARPAAPKRPAADTTVVARIIALGGSAKKQPTDQLRQVVAAAAGQVLAGKTTVLYLGDNLPPSGLGSSEEAQSQAAALLKEKYQPFIAQGVPVYFMPGEKDWDNSGPQGLVKINRSGAFIRSLGDSLVRQVPENGCPDPQLIQISDQLVVIVMDSQWWLHVFDKDNKGADCGCLNERDIVSSLRELLYQNRYKTIILATHHPFRDYGHYNGDFTVKDHIFPLTRLQKDLYLPLPVIGSLYLGLNSVFQTPQQLHHPLYQGMRSMVSKVFTGFPNLMQLSAHEGGLQVIGGDGHTSEDKQPLQIISAGLQGGQGTALSGKMSQFHVNEPGFVLLDQLADGRVVIKIEAGNQIGGFPEVFRYVFTPKPYQAVEQRQSLKIAADSMMAAPHAAYNKVSGMHKWLFGKNYREGWALPVKLPVLRVSDIHGGLQPLKLGGGFQSTSLRMADPEGRQYTLRSVEKSSDLITPEAFQGTFVKDWLDDATSAQHPYGALVVPPLAEAVGVLHASPVVGVVAPDTALGAYGRLFEGKVTLLEEREPAGNTDNTLETLDKLQEDNDNDFDGEGFLRARGLDYLLADWDRHEDQWRFQKTGKKGKPKYYRAVPRDRDMALNVTQGFIADIAKRLILMPRVFGFSYKNPMRGSNYYFYKSDFLDAHPSFQIGFDRWHQIAEAQQAKLTDALLDSALHRIPAPVLALKHDQLLSQLKARRDHLAAAMDKYYALSNKFVDIHASDKNEWISIKDAPDENALDIVMQKISKKGNIQDTLMYKRYPRKDTREIRLYLGKGDDSVFIDNPNSTVRLRLIGGKGHKYYDVAASRNRIRVYDHQKEKYFGEDKDQLKVSVNPDSTQTAFMTTNRYNTVLPLVTGGYNADDKLSIGVGAKFILQNGFRKTPYSSTHQIMIRHSFATKAYRIAYSGVWKSVIGKADLVADLDVNAPNNTQNYFGRGNQTVMQKFEGYEKYYRTRFTTVNLFTGLHWNFNKKDLLQVGPGFEYYHMDPADNSGRFVEVNPGMIGSYDSATLFKDKLHAGLRAVYEMDHRNNSVLPQWGVYARVELKAYKGLNDLSRNFAQLLPQLAVYKPLDNRKSLILSDRIGGGLSVGQTAFYQSVFIGGEGSLLGYRKYRFAGQQALYNNLELRWSLMDFGNYIIKGEFGLTGFFDVGRVWQSAQRSSKWHNGTGGGIYFAPAGLTVFKFVMGHSAEGWYPYFTMGLRF